MANTLSFPFRLAANGGAAVVPQNSDQYYNEQIAAIILTIQTEREFEPGFGMPDLAFAGFPYSNFQYQIRTYLPGLKNVTATITDVTDDTQTVNVEFNSEE